MIWNRIGRVWIFQIDVYSFDSSTLRLKSVFSYRFGYRIHRYFRFNRRRGGSRFIYGNTTRYSRGFFVRPKHGNIGIVPFGDGGNNNSVTLLLCGGVIIRLCLGHGCISRGAIELAESEELRLRINHGMNRGARSWFKSHLRFSIIS